MAGAHPAQLPTHPPLKSSGLYLLNPPLTFFSQNMTKKGRQAFSQLQGQGSAQGENENQKGEEQDSSPTPSTGLSLQQRCGQWNENIGIPMNFLKTPCVCAQRYELPCGAAMTINPVARGKSLAQAQCSENPNC